MGSEMCIRDSCKHRDSQLRLDCRFVGDAAVLIIGKSSHGPPASCGRQFLGAYCKHRDSELRHGRKYFWLPPAHSSSTSARIPRRALSPHYSDHTTSYSRSSHHVLKSVVDSLPDTISNGVLHLFGPLRLTRLYLLLSNERPGFFAGSSYPVQKPTSFLK